LKCESLSLGKYLEKSQNIFFIFGSEVVLRNNSKDLIKECLSQRGFNERRVINKENFDQIEQIIIESSGGSLFGSRLIIDINHDQGRLPDKLEKIFQIDKIFNNENIAIIINSHNDKLNSRTRLYKAMEKNSLIVECSKLKSFEEKIWLKSQLEFIPAKDRKNLINNMYELNAGNLVAQQNEISILKLIYKNDIDISNLFHIDSAEFVPFELEDALINLNVKHALRITKSIKDSEAHYAPLLVWIIGKIVTTSAIAKQNTNTRLSLEKSGVWSNKVSSYMNFIKFHSLQELISMQKNVYELDLTSKGLSKNSFWDDIDRMIVNLTTN
jgi:DNA polymerase III delta subunit